MKMWRLQTDTAVSAAILCLAVWVCDINKARTCGTSVFYDVGQARIFIDKEHDTLRRSDLKQKKKEILLHTY